MEILNFTRAAVTGQNMSCLGQIFQSAYDYFRRKNFSVFIYGIFMGSIIVSTYMHLDLHTIELCSFTTSASPTGKKYGGGGGVLTPNHVCPVFLYIFDLKHSENLGVTFRAHSFLLKNLKKVQKNHNFFGKIRKLVFAYGAGQILLNLIYFYIK